MELPSSLPEGPFRLRLGKSRLHAIQHRAHRRRTKRHRGATALVWRCLEIAEYFGYEWCLENPATGLLKRQPLMEGLPFTDVTYCRYGFDYRKQTRLWHSRAFGEAFRPQPICCKATPCPAFAANGAHPKSAHRGADHARGGGRKQNDGCSQVQLYSMPPTLCDEIAQAAEACRPIAP